MHSGGNWIALFSGGKDSSWALHQARLEGATVNHLLTAQPSGDSYLFHVPATGLTRLLAESISIPHTTFSLEPATATDSGKRGDQELEVLADAIEAVQRKHPDRLTGIVTGAVESNFQRDRIRHLCDRYGLEEFSPLWQCPHETALRSMIEAGFDIRIVSVAAGGLDRSWLGRQLTENALEDLKALRDEYGIHLLGEGGEYETLVVDGPHMDRRLQFDASTEWDGTRGHLRIEDAWLAQPQNDH